MKHCDFTNKTKRNPIFYIEFDNAADKIGIIDFDQFQQMGLNKLPLFQQAAFSHFKTTNRYSTRCLSWHAVCQIEAELYGTRTLRFN